MKSGTISVRIHRNPLLFGAALYLLVYFILFFTTNFIGTALNWQFWLLPAFYAIYLHQAVWQHAKKQKRTLWILVGIVTVLSFMGLYLAHLTFAFLVILSFELISDFALCMRRRILPDRLLSEVFLLTPVVFMLIDRMYFAGLLTLSVLLVSGLAVVVYGFLRWKKIIRLPFLVR